MKARLRFGWLSGGLLATVGMALADAFPASGARPPVDDLAANAFYLDLRDQQVTVRSDPLDPTSPSLVVKDGESQTYGFEIEARTAVMDGLLALLSVGFVIANAQLGFQYNRFTATVFAESIFDEEYLLYRHRDSVETPGAGRLIGVSPRREVLTDR